MKEEHQTQREVKYFIANFGQAHAENPVDGGYYPVYSWFGDTKMISKGDVMLLCCWGGHKGLWKGDAWGLGKVTGKEEREENLFISYRYRQFVPPIKGDDVYDCLTDAEKRKFRGARLTANWLFNITPVSFLCAVSK
ncbi:MAG: hypothetical protein WB564_02785 [Dehalococcoidia bacterium]